MLFGKTERKKGSPAMALTVGALAMIGAFSIVRCTKRMMQCTCDKMTSMVKHVMKKDSPQSDCGCE